MTQHTTYIQCHAKHAKIRKGSGQISRGPSHPIHRILSRCTVGVGVGRIIVRPLRGWCDGRGWNVHGAIGSILKPVGHEKWEIRR